MKMPAKTEAKNFSGTGFPIFADFCGTAEKSAGFVFRPVEFSDNYSPFFLVFEMEDLVLFSHFFNFRKKIRKNPLLTL
ncbi:hypothetical protein [Caldibacillus debilis]|uniref:hypothetical protein n=1 Tax=Caldibacillus debilis TaxID=301148 RepID=UPI0023F21EB3|nr:hypothetical protein [Caldibacillus debilis]